VATEGGIDLYEARIGLSELASALAGAEGLSVSSSTKGDLLYSFPADVRRELAARSSAARARDAWNAAKPGLQITGRVLFGVALFASIAIIFAAIAVLSAEAAEGGGSNRRDGDGRRGDGAGGRGALDGFAFGYGWSPLDLLFPRPYSYGWFRPPPKMSLPEAIFSFCFGDGDPNAALRAARLRALAETIRNSGGAVIAESIAPFLDPPPLPRGQERSITVDESWVLPAVLELGGSPEVTDDGTIVYVFDELVVSGILSEADLVLADPALAPIASLDAADLQRLADERNVPIRGSGDADSLRAALQSWAASQLASSGGGGRSLLLEQGYLEERETPFSNAEGGQLFAAGALGLVNLGGAAYLGNLLSQLPPGAVLPDELGVLQSLFPALAVYAVSYVALPIVRFARLRATNDAVKPRNSRRRAWRDWISLNSAILAKRLDAARRRRPTRRVISEGDVAFDSAKGLTEQEMEAPAFEDFDRRLGSDM
jgi:hypothetical protein